jgi:hypothetical protein
MERHVTLSECCHSGTSYQSLVVRSGAQNLDICWHVLCNSSVSAMVDEFVTAEGLKYLPWC